MIACIKILIGSLALSLPTSVTTFYFKIMNRKKTNGGGKKTHKITRIYIFKKWLIEEASHAISLRGRAANQNKQLLTETNQWNVKTHHITVTYIFFYQEICSWLSEWLIPVLGGWGNALVRADVISLPELRAYSISCGCQGKAPSAFTHAAWKASQRLVQRLAAVGMTHKQPISEEQLFQSEPLKS